VCSDHSDRDLYLCGRQEDTIITMSGFDDLLNLDGPITDSSQGQGVGVKDTFDFLGSGDASGSADLLGMDFGASVSWLLSFYNPQVKFK